MASYVIELSTASNNLANWKPVQLTVEDAAYCMANGGHMAFEIAGFAPTDGMVYTIGITWADCDESTRNAVIGVSKYQELIVQTVSTPTGKNGAYMIDFSTPSDRFIETYGLGTVIDRRTSPVSTPKRIAFVGLVTSGASQLPLTLILTPTKIV